MSSNAVISTAVSAVTGLTLAKGNFNPNSPYLPQSIVILGEANTANQSGLTFNVVQQITSAQQAATLYGQGSPIHRNASIYFPQTGQGVGVPVYACPLAETGVAKVITVTPSGNATATGTIYLNIAGRESVNGASYAVNIVSGDTPTQQCDKFRTAIAAALGTPVIGTGTTTLIATAKWKGLTSNGIAITIDLGSTSNGVTYAVANTTPGSGTPATATALANFGSAWYTMIDNTLGWVTATVGELESYNGVPDPTTPTGQYGGTIMRPLWAFTGSVLDDSTGLTSAAGRVNQVTMVLCPAPLSAGLPFEASANMIRAICGIWQDTPASDALNQGYPDMPPPPAGSIPAMNSYAVRDAAVKLGCSTVDFVAGQYIIKDIVTTYDTAGEYPPFYRWVRDLNIYFNWKFRYHLREQQKLVGKVIVKNSDTVTAPNVIKPKQWAAEVADLVDGGVRDGLIVDAAFSDASIVVAINSQNPNRIDTTYNIKISGIARICATTVTGGFNFTN